ncbi:MAG: bacteriohemerythrin [Thermodesulfobacteriota bacterium]
MPEKFKWQAEYRTGFDKIDAQHRLLFAIANELIQIDVDSPESKYEYKYLFSHLTDYVKEHFAAEEKLMDTIGYPEAEDHKDKHQFIISEINSSLKSSKSTANLKQNLESLLTKWIKDHVLNEDKKIEQWYNNI